MSKTPEGKVKHEIKLWLTKRAAYWFMPVQAGYGRRAVDFLCCIDGVFVAIETKAGAGQKPSMHQEQVLEDVRIAGGIGVWGWDAAAIVNEVEARLARHV